MASAEDELPPASTRARQARAREAPTMKWTAKEEIQLFFALDSHRPFGINKHFHMMFISERLSRVLNRNVSSEMIWAHLRTLYNLEALDAMEPLPFPNEIEDFSLPDSEFAELLAKKCAKRREERRLRDVRSSADGDRKEKGKSKSHELEKDVRSKDDWKHEEIPKRSQRRKRK